MPSGKSMYVNKHSLQNENFMMPEHCSVDIICVLKKTFSMSGYLFRKLTVSCNVTIFSFKL